MAQSGRVGRAGRDRESGFPWSIRSQRGGLRGVAGARQVWMGRELHLGARLGGLSWNWLGWVERSLLKATGAGGSPQRRAHQGRGRGGRTVSAADRQTGGGVAPMHNRPHQTRPLDECAVSQQRVMAPVVPNSPFACFELEDGASPCVENGVEG